MKQTTLENVLYDSRAKKHKNESAETKTGGSSKDFNLFNPILLDVHLDNTLQDIVHDELRNLIGENKDDWSMNQEFRLALHKLCNNIANQCIKRASYFGEYRFLSDKGEKPTNVKSDKKHTRVAGNVKETDFSFAWLSLKDDAESN